jgi:hypothetical protein
VSEKFSVSVHSFFNSINILEKYIEIFALKKSEFDGTKFIFQHGT